MNSRSRKAICNKTARFAVGLGALAATQAWAQPAPPAAAASAPAADAAAEARGGPLQLKEVIVTAQKRPQSASKTPIALTAVTGETLREAGVTTAKNLPDLVPNVQIGAAGGSSVEVSIRGVASVNNSEVGDPAASFNVDGVALGRPQGAGAAFFDLERVEVLRGPQGTLYGRNSTAGALNLITNKPKNKFEAAVYGELGNLDNRLVEGMLNLPVTSDFALRGVLSANKRDGFIETRLAPGNTEIKDRSDRDNLSGRLQGLYTFNRDTSLRVSGDISKDKGTGTGAVLYETLAAHKTGKDGRRVTLPIEGTLDNETWGVSAEFNTATPVGQFTAIAAHRVIDREETQPAGAATTIYTIDTSKTKQDTLELRLGGGSVDALQWVAGVFLFDEKGSPIQRLVPNVLNRRLFVDPMVNKSKAVFGQATYAVLKDLRLTAGLRYTKDEKSREGFFEPLVGTVGPAGSNKAAVDYGKTTGKLGVDYDLTPTTMLYGSVSTGYKAGGFNDGVQTPTADPTYRPETLTSYEVGAKGRFLANTLQLNASVFHYKFKDMQLSGFGINPLTGLEGTFTRNAARANITGLELEGRVLFGLNDRLNFALGLLDAKYDDYQITRTVNWKDVRLDKSPRGTLTLGYTHDWELPDGALVSATLGTRWSTAYVFSNYGAALQYRQGSFAKSDLNVTYRSADERWSVQAFIKNIQDRNIMVAYQSTQVNSAFLDEPRTFGIRAGIKF